MPQFLAAVLLMVAASVPAATAEESWPDLTGVWSGEAPAVVRGNPLHHQLTEPSDEVRISNLVITVTVEGQEGRNFWGTVASPHATESLVGAIAADRMSLHFVSTVGYTRAVLLEPDMMEVCYLQASAEMQVAVCRTMTRED